MSTCHRISQTSTCTKMDTREQLVAWIMWIMVAGAIATPQDAVPRHVYREDWKERSCSAILRRVTHRQVEVEMPPQLDGLWTSHRCEIRSGPQFVLRSHKFQRSKFESHIYHYSDADCSKPLYAFVAHGTLQLMQESWAIPGAMEGRYLLDVVLLVAYSTEAAASLMRQLKPTCGRRFANVTFEPFRKYIILNDPPPDPRDGSEKTGVDSNLQEEFDCSLPLNFSLNELQLLRVESRVHHSSPPIGQSREKDVHAHAQTKGARVVRELFLGDVHTELTERQWHRPSSFQEPLTYAETSACGVCSRLRDSDALAPPRLAVHQGTLLSLQGEWVSTRCESRQYGQFLTRWLHFLGDGLSWEGRYEYYHDALCRQPTFTLRAKGSYIGGQESEVIMGSKTYSFKTTRLRVTPKDDATADTLNRYEGPECGQAGQWVTDQEQDVTGTSGCVTLGIRLPSLEQDLMRMEAVHRKLFLYVGQRTSDQPVRAYHVPPPFAFQAPLVKCDAEDLDMSINSLPDEHAHALAMTSLDKFEGDSKEHLTGEAVPTVSKGRFFHTRVILAVSLVSLIKILY